MNVPSLGRKGVARFALPNLDIFHFHSAYRHVYYFYSMRSNMTSTHCLRPLQVISLAFREGIAGWLDFGTTFNTEDDGVVYDVVADEVDEPYDSDWDIDYFSDDDL